MPPALRSRRRLAAVGLACVLGATLAGCGAEDHVAVREGDLKGRLYVAADAEKHELAPGGEATLTFGDGVVTAFGGCNADGAARYSLTGQRLNLANDDDPFGQMGGGCERALEAQDVWLHDVVWSRPSVRIRKGGESLVLATGDETVIFFARERPEGRRVIPRRERERFNETVAALKTETSEKSEAIRSRMDAGTLSRRAGRARIKALEARLSAGFDRARARARASTR